MWKKRFLLSIIYYLFLTFNALSSRLPNSLHPSLNSTLPKRRPGNSITLQHWPINTDRNTLILGAIQLSSLDASRFSSSLARDLEIDTVGVVLGTVGLVCTVQSDDFVTEHVGAGGQRGGDGDGPGVVVCDESV